MPRKLFKLKLAKSKGKKLTPISEETHTASVTGGEAEEKVEQLPPELPPPDYHPHGSLREARPLEWRRKE